MNACPRHIVETIEHRSAEDQLFDIETNLHSIRDLAEIAEQIAGEIRVNGHVERDSERIVSLQVAVATMLSKQIDDVGEITARLREKINADT